jgi:hypothetical protein
MDELAYRQHIFVSPRVGINAWSRKKLITISMHSQSGVFRLIAHLPFFFISLCIFPSRFFFISTRIIPIHGQVWQTLTISFLFTKCKKKRYVAYSLCLSLCITFRCKPHPFFRCIKNVVIFFVLVGQLIFFIGPKFVFFSLSLSPFYY